jgi:hypothetical protein
MQDWEHDLPKGFLMNCLNAAGEDGVVLFAADKSEEDVAAWLGKKKESMCTDYHVHDKKEKGKSTGKVMWPPKLKVKVKPSGASKY